MRNAEQGYVLCAYRRGLKDGEARTSTLLAPSLPQCVELISQGVYPVMGLKLIPAPAPVVSQISKTANGMNGWHRIGRPGLISDIAVTYAY